MIVFDLLDIWESPRLALLLHKAAEARYEEEMQVKICRVLAAVGVAVSSVLALSALAVAAPMCTPPSGGIIGWWSGDETTIDVTGRNVGGVLRGDATFAPGKVGQAILFRPGAGVDLGRRGGDPGAAGFTVELWVWVGDFAADTVLIEKSVDFAMPTSPAANAGWFLGTSRDRLVFEFRGGLRLSAGSLTRRAWHHVAVTRAGTAVALFVDGRVRAAGTIDAPTPDASGPLTIGAAELAGIARPGARDHGPSPRLAVDELAIYDRALDARQIEAIVQAGPAGKCKPPAAPGPIGYWPLDGDGSDESGGGRHLELVGGVSFADGLLGRALALHGDGRQFVARPKHDSIFRLDTGDFTVQAWVNFNETERVQILLELFTGRSGPGWTLYKYSGRVLHFWAAPAAVVRSAEIPIEAGTWHHVVARRRGSDFQLVFDGKLVAHESSPSAISVSDMPLLFGRRNDLDGRDLSLDGRIDEVAIWSRALDDGEIAFLFNGGIGNPAVPLGPAQNSAPIADAGERQIVAAQAACLAPVTVDGRRSRDPEGDPLEYSWSGPFGIARDPVAVVTLPVGTHTVTLRVDDGRGGTSSDQVLVTVDPGSPEIQMTTVEPGVLWPANRHLVPVTVGVRAKNSCGTVTCRIVSVASNERTGGPGEEDWIMTGPLSLRLRAERSKAGTDRIYALTVMCTDEFGNTSTKPITVTVPASQTGK